MFLRSIRAAEKHCSKTRKLSIWSHLLKTSWMENLSFCAVISENIVSETKMNPGQYPADTKITAGDFIINGIHGECLSWKNYLIKVHNFPGAIRWYAA